MVEPALAPDARAKPGTPAGSGEHGISVAGFVPGLFVLLWATGFLAAKFVVPYAEPIFVLVVRFALAALMMLLIALIFGARWPRSWPQIGHIAVTGILLHAVYLGGCYSAVAAGLPAGLAALIAGLQPIITALLAKKLLGERLRPLQWLGVALGFIGLILVMWHKLVIDTGQGWGLFLAFVQLFGITAATIYQKRYCPTADLKAGAVIQYVAATLFLLPLLAWQGIGETIWAPAFIGAMAWMVIVLSGISIALLTWMIQRGAASRVASLFYLTPPTAAFGAYILFGEQLGPLALFGMAVIAFGVALVSRA